MTEHLALIDASTADRRLRGQDVRVLFRLCRHELTDTEFKRVKYDTVADPLRTSRGNVRNSMMRLREAGYLLHERRGVGGRSWWRLPAVPMALKAKLHQ